MASEIKVDTIVNAGGDNDTGIDLATNDQILLKVANATKLTMNSTGQTTIVGEGGTTTTSLQQGLCKVWVNYTGVSTTASRDSLNVSSLTDVSTGITTVNISNSFNNTDYTGSYYTNANSGSSLGSFSNHHVGMFGNRQTSSYQHHTYTASAVVDSFHNDSTIFGDLA